MNHYVLLSLSLLINGAFLNASEMQPKKQHEVTTCLMLPKIPGHSTQEKHPLFTIYFGEEKPVTCNLFPGNPETVIHDLNLLMEAITQFRQLKEKTRNYTLEKKQAAFKEQEEGQHFRLMAYKILLNEYRVVHEDKDASQLLNRINTELQELERTANPYLARLCFEKSKRLADPDYKAPFLTFLEIEESSQEVSKQS